MEQIQSIAQLNKFVGSSGIVAPAQIINKLVDEKVVINHSVAKLIVKHQKSALF